MCVKGLLLSTIVTAQIVQPLDHALYLEETGLINIGGEILKTLFGTATNSDVHLLHDVVNDLQQKNAVTVHSLAN